MSSRDTVPPGSAYASPRGWERRWTPPARHLLAGLLALEALLAAAFALWPPHPANRALDAGLAILLGAAAVGCAATWRRRGPLWLLHAWLALAWGVPIVFVATRALEASQLLWANLALLVALLAAFYLPWRSAAGQVTALVVAFVAATVVPGEPTRTLFVAGFVVLAGLSAVAAASVRAERERLITAIADMATTDALTGLLNRRGLEDEAAVVRANAARAGQSTVVALLDLDGLKHVNDTRGHRAGDAFIAEVARHLRATVRQGDLVARVGGDEFVIVLPGVDERAAADLLTRIRESATQPWSHGWTAWSGAEPLDTAISRADDLMYVDKSRRRPDDDMRRRRASAPAS